MLNKHYILLTSSPKSRADEKQLAKIVTLKRFFSTSDERKKFLQNENNLHLNRNQVRLNSDWFTGMAGSKTLIFFSLICTFTFEKANRKFVLEYILNAIANWFAWSITYFVDFILNKHQKPLYWKIGLRILISRDGTIC